MPLGEKRKVLGVLLLGNHAHRVITARPMRRAGIGISTRLFINSYKVKIYSLHS